MILRELTSKFDASLCESLSVLKNRTPEQREYIENVCSTEHLECPMGVTESPCSMDATRMGIVFAFSGRIDRNGNACVIAMYIDSRFE